MKVFLAVAEEGNVTRAAARLFTAQPAVSRSLRELETFIGSALFERSSTGLTLTKAGERFWSHAKASLSSLDQGIISARGSGDVATVILGALPNLIRNVLPIAVANFKSRHPNVPLRILTGTNLQLLHALDLGAVHLVIGRLAAPDFMKSLTFERLWDEELIFATAPDHPLTKLGTLSLEQINQFEVIIPEPKTSIRTELDRILLTGGINQFSNYIETISAEFARTYITQFPAVFVFPKGSVKKELEARSIIQLDVNASKSVQPVGVSKNPSVKTPEGTEQFLSCLRHATKSAEV